ncbi:MAG: CYTH and CHAD domain-containing protein [Ilumatobacteraceae bacterium]
MIEREIKLSAAAGMTMPDLAAAAPGIRVGSPSVLQLDAVYFDTPSLALARWGATLRSRSGEPGAVWTLKLPVAVDGSQLLRHECTFDEPVGPIPVAAHLAARGYARSQALGPVVRLHTERVTFDLEIDGRPLATICDDTVVAEGGVDTVSTFREIEVELAQTTGVPAQKDLDALDAVVKSLRNAGCSADDVPIAKALRALGSRAVDPPDVTIPEIGKHATIETVVRHTIARSVTQIIGRHACICAGNDSEALHQFRVAARRLRSDLRTFLPLLDAHWTNWLREELSWLAGEVGIGRDADVLSERLRAQLARLPDRDAKSVDDLVERLSATTSEAFAHVLTTLSGDRYLELLDALVDGARNPRFAAESPEVALRAARPNLIALVRKPWRRLNRAVDALTPDAHETALHAIRILCKRARYAADAVVPLYGRPARRFGSAMAEVQTVLGSYQDTTVAEAWLRDAARAVPSTRLVAGELIGFERDDRSRLRAEFAVVWKKASRRKLRKWMK